MQTVFPRLSRRSGVGIAAGVVAMLLVAAGTVGLSYTGFGTTRQDSTPAIRWVGRALMLLGLPLTVVAWLLVRQVSSRWQWATLALWSLPLIFVAPVLSRDMYAYAEQGFLVLQGLDPYTTAMGSRGGPFADLVDVFWRGTTTVYPPGTLAVQHLVVAATGSHPYWSVIAMRIPAILSLVVMGVLVPRLATAYGIKADAARWAVLLNPVAVLHIVGGGHNDALAAALAVVAVWLACPRTNGGWRWGWLVGCLLAGVAASVKQPLALVVVGAAAFAVPAHLDRWRRLLDLGVRSAIGGLIAAVGFGLVTALSGLGLGWLAGSGAPFSVKTAAPASLLADAASATGWVSFPAALRVTGPIVLLAGLCAVAWWGWRTLWPSTRKSSVPGHGPGPVGGPLVFLAGAFLATVVALPGFQPWYLLWGGAYAAASGWFERFPRTVLGVVAFCLALAWLTECVGVAPLWSALLAAALGSAVARLTPIHSLLDVGTGNASRP